MYSVLFSDLVAYVGSGNSVTFNHALLLHNIFLVCRNVKHAFYQPAENEMITLVHFHLIHPIMVGKKKTSDVQFYAEVMDTVQTLDAGRRSM